ncbi:hypothetical protein KKC60_05800 [Patescibacteria group bacterium]|nr:hypothetical protein [Patescibacteria group bacterium]
MAVAKSLGATQDRIMTPLQPKSSNFGASQMAKEEIPKEAQAEGGESGQIGQTGDAQTLDPAEQQQQQKLAFRKQRLKAQKIQKKKRAAIRKATIEKRKAKAQKTKRKKAILRFIIANSYWIAIMLLFLVVLIIIMAVLIYLLNKYPTTTKILLWTADQSSAFFLWAVKTLSKL